MAKSSIAGLTVTIGADTNQFSKAIKELDAEARNIAKDLKTVNDNLKLDPNNVQKTAQSMELLQQQAQKASDKVNLIKDAMKKLTSEYSAGKVSADDYNSSMNHLTMLLSQAQNEQDLVNEKIRQFGQETDTSGKHALSLGDIIKANLISDVIKTGLHKIADAAKAIGKACWDALKSIAEGTVKFVSEGISLAEEYRQTAAKVKQIYGDLSQDIIDWSKNAATAMGITSGEAQAAAATFGNMFAALDVGTVKTDQIDTNFAEMSKNLVQLAADVAAFNNVTTDEVLQAFQSGLAGTSRQLRVYGIVINENLVKQKALELGLKATTDELTEGDKIIARYALMMEQGAVQSGQFARESESATVQTQIFKAQIKELQASIGEKLIPVQAKLLDLVNTLISNPAVQKFLDTVIDEVGRLSDAFLMLFNDVNWDDLDGSFGDLLQQISNKLMTVLPSVMQFGQEIIEMMIKGINENLPLILAEALPIINTLIKGIIEALPMLAEGALQILQTIIDAITNNIGTLAPTCATVIRRLAEFIIENLPALLETAIEIVVELANGIADALPELIPAAVSVIMKLAQTLIDNLPKILEAAHNLIIGFATGLINAIPEIIKALPQLITSMVSFFAENYTKIAETGLELLKQLITNLPEIIESVLVGVATLLASIVDYFKNHWEDIKQAGKDLITNLWDGIVSMAGWFQNKFTGWISGIWESIKNIFKGDADNWQDEFQLNDPIMSGNDPYAGYESAYIPSAGTSGFFGSSVSNVNNSRNVGEVVVNVASYGANAAEIADEIGMAVQNKLRMSGAML